jgi:hypothetical protein
MPQIVPYPIPLPDLPPGEFIWVDKGVVYFWNFGVGKSNPQKAHTDFISRTVVPFLMANVEAMKFEDKSIELHLYGEASATGAADRNKALSLARADEIGKAIAQEFNRQKSGGKFSRGVVIVPQPEGQGFTAARAALKAKQALTHRTYTSAQIEADEFMFRCVIVKVMGGHLVVDRDKDVFAREVFGCKFKDEKVPLTLLDQKLAELGDNGPLSFAFTFVLGLIKGELKSAIKSLIEGADFAAPEIMLLFDTIDFITPTDATLGFQFKDPRGRIVLYKLTGSLNSKNFGSLDLISYLLGFTDWMKKLDKAIDTLMGKALSPEQIKLLGNLKKVVNQVKSQLSDKLRDVLRPGGLARTLLGDALCDTLLSYLEKGLAKGVLIFSEFEPVVFTHPGVYDIGTFGGPARAFSTIIAGKATTQLEFLGAGPEGLLGFNASVDFLNGIGADFVLGGVSLLRGSLVTQPDSLLSGL